MPLSGGLLRKRPQRGLKVKNPSPAGLAADRNTMAIVTPERARQRLSEERSRVEQSLAALAGEPPSDEPGDFTSGGAQLDQAERDEAIREELNEVLAAIERAERRLEDGTYGVSVASGEPIPDARLEAIPWAERKVEEEGGAR